MTEYSNKYYCLVSLKQITDKIVSYEINQYCVLAIRITEICESVSANTGSPLPSLMLLPFQDLFQLRCHSSKFEPEFCYRCENLSLYSQISGSNFVPYVRAYCKH